MRTVMAVMLVLCAPLMCLANPVPTLDALQFGTDEGLYCVWPSEGAEFTVTVVVDIDNLMYLPRPDGVIEVAFMFERSFGGEKIDERCLLGGPYYGDVENGGVVACAAPGDCVLPDEDGLVPVAEIVYVYSGSPGLIHLIAVPGIGGLVALCPPGCTPWSNSLPSIAGVGMESPNGCNVSPVHDLGWSAIKALYR